MKIDELLDEDLESEMGKLRTTKYDDKDYKVVSDTVGMLWDKKIEWDKVKSEQLFREKQLKEDKKDHWIKNILALFGIVLPAVITVWGTKKSLKFEEEGTITTAAGRNFLSRLFSKK